MLGDYDIITSRNRWFAAQVAKDADAAKPNAQTVRDNMRDPPANYFAPFGVVSRLRNFSHLPRELFVIHSGEHGAADGR